VACLPFWWPGRETLSDSIFIRRDVPIEQTTHIPPSGPLDVPAINIQISRLIAIDQQLQLEIDRAIMVDQADPVPTPLPNAAARALMNLTFDADGNPTASLPAAGTAAISSVMAPVVAAATLPLARGELGIGNAAVSIAINTTINAATQNSNRYVASAALTMTLAKADTFTNGFGFWIDASGGDVTVTPDAADNIDSYGVGVSFTVPMGAKVYIATDAATAGVWAVYGMPWLVQNPRSCTGTRNITRADNGKILKHNSGAFGIFQFPAAASLPSNFRCLIVNGETTAIGKGVGGTDVGSFTQYPGQSYLVINDNGTVRLVGGKRLYRIEGVEVFTHATSGSDNPLVADGLADGARANKTLSSSRLQLLQDFDHSGSQPKIWATGTFDESLNWGGAPINAGVVFIYGTSEGAFLWRPASGSTPYCCIFGDGAVIIIKNIYTDGNTITSTAFELHQTAILDVGYPGEASSGCAFGSHGTPGGVHIGTDGAGWTLNMNGNYKLNGAGGAAVHISAVGSGVVNHAGGITITITNTPNVTTWFRGNGPNLISLGAGVTWTGGLVAGCTKWSIGPASYISLGGNAANVPGSVAGSPATGSAPAAATGWAVA
jgi:hypothetical protein